MTTTDGTENPQFESSEDETSSNERTSSNEEELSKNGQQSVKVETLDENGKLEIELLSSYIVALRQWFLTFSTA